MNQNEIEEIYNTKMTNDELKTFYIPKNVPRSPTTKEYEDIMHCGMDDPEEYILTWFYDKGGEGKLFEIEGDDIEYDDIEYDDIEYDDIEI